MHLDAVNELEVLEKACKTDLPDLNSVIYTSVEL
jgi:hypothetical protein